MGIDAEMFARVRSPITEADVKLAAWDLCATFGAERFWDFKPPLHIVERWEQDGPDIEPQPNEVFVRVMLGTRYYGKGYERGDLPLIVSVAEWLEQRFPGCEVWYGGDSSGVCAERFNTAARDEMKRHYYAHGHAPYVGGFGRGIGGERPSNRPSPCARCVPGRDKHETGWGPTGSLLLHCAGCGKYFGTRDGGETWTEGKNSDEAWRRPAHPLIKE